MEKIITLEDGRMFLLNTSETLTPEYEESIISQLNSRMSKLATGCGITIPKGTTKNIRCSASNGTGRYLYELYMNGTKVNQSPVGSGGSYTFSHIFNTVGTINVSIKVTDDCSTPSVCNESSCTVTVTESLPTVSSIELTGCDAIHSVGGTCTITPVCKDSSGNGITCPTLIWTSSSPSKVTVSPTTNNKGLCTFVADGSSTITASAGSVSGSKTVFVGVVPKKYKCIDNTCKEDPSGTFDESTCGGTCTGACKTPVCNFTIE